MGLLNAHCLSKLLDAAKFAKLVCMLPEQSRGFARVTIKRGLDWVVSILAHSSDFSENVKRSESYFLKPGSLISKLSIKQVSITRLVSDVAVQLCYGVRLNMEVPVQFSGIACRKETRFEEMLLLIQCPFNVLKW